MHERPAAVAAKEFNAAVEVVNGERPSDEAVHWRPLSKGTVGIFLPPVPHSRVVACRDELDPTILIWNSHNFSESSAHVCPGDAHAGYPIFVRDGSFRIQAIV